MTARIICIGLLISYQVSGFSFSPRFHHITSKDGISQSEVYSFLEDSNGFMWIGTVYGLNRYDGYNITIFTTEKGNPNSITNNTIRSLGEDESGRVWIGTDDGLCVYNSFTEKIHQVSIKGYENKRLSISSILISGDNLFLGTSLGFFKGSINTSKLEEISNSLQLLEIPNDFNGTINVITKDKDGKIWIGSGGSVLGLVFQEETSDPIIIDHIRDEQFWGIRQLHVDANNNIWVITHHSGFFRYNQESRKLDRFKKNNPNSSITTSNCSAAASDNAGNLWIGTRDKGLLFLPANQLTNENPIFEQIQHNPIDESSLNSNLIFSLYFSKSNLLWIGTIGSGINIFDPQQKEFNHYKIPIKDVETHSGSNFIRSVYADKSNNIWIGTHNNGLHILNRRQNTFRKGAYETESIFFIYEIGDNKTLINTSRGTGIAQMNNYGELEIINTDVSATSFYSCKSKDNIMWIATLIGLVKCRLMENDLVVETIYDTSTDPGISFNNCRVLYYNEETNELLVGTEGGGLNILKLNDNHEVVEVTTYMKNASPNSISNNSIRSIIKDSKGNIWLGTYEGLNKLIRNESNDSISFRSFTQKEGLPNNMVQLIVEDNSGNLWIGTNNGLCKFDIQTETFVRYSISDGIQSNEFSEHAVFKKADGEIIVGGINGFNTFYPEKISLSTNNPKTTVTNFFLFNKEVGIEQGKKKRTPLVKSITYTDSIFLQSDQNSLSFEFSALIYYNPEKVQYAYKLEGFDNDWNYTNAMNRHATYTNLGYGDYVFRVKSTNNDGQWEETTSNIYVHIRTPFVFTWMAFVMYGLFIILITIYFTNYTVIKYTTKKKILLENEHNQQLHELDILRTRFFINVSHDLRTPLTLISSPIEIALKNRDLKKEVRNNLNVAYRNVQKLKYMTEQLLDISKSEAGKLKFKPQNGDFASFIKKEASHFTDAIRSKGLTLSMIIQDQSITCRFDPDMISKVLFNILSNAIKYTNEGEIIVRVEVVSSQAIAKSKSSKRQSYIKVEIQDTGKGISQGELDKIFDRYYQGKEKNSKGYGIGLSHCKELIETHEGIIEATSLSDSGTTIRFFIPFIEAINDEPQKVTPAPPSNILVESPDNYPEERDYDTPVNLQKVLIIEDNDEMRKFIKSELQKRYKIFEASDGLEGLKLVEKYLPDLIISDIMMPNMDGIEFCKKIKINSRTSHIPVVLLTAKGEAQTKYESIEIGADDYISKPFDMEYLFIRIKNLLNYKDQLRKLFQSNSNLEPSDVTLPSHDDKFFSKLMSVIEEGIPDPEFTVNSLEEKMGMSHTNFYRKIKNMTGQSGKEILMSMRMKRAKQILLDSENIRISEVAYAVGFSNPKYFSKCFKEYYGILPSEYHS